MKKILEIYPQLQIVLDFEEIDKNAENYIQRIRRKNRDGFKRMI